MPHLPRWLWIPSLAQLLLGGALCFVPLFNLLGYEFSAAIAAAAVVTATIIGLGAGRSAASSLRALCVGCALALAHLVPPLVLISLNAARVRNCDTLEGLAFFALLPVPTALYAAAQAVAARRLVTAAKRWQRALVVVALLVAPLAWTLWHFYWHPPIFLFDHLWGHVAGSLYDEVVRIDAPLYAFRAGTLLRIAGIATLLALWERRMAIGMPRLVAAAAVTIALCAIYEATAGPHWGFRVWRSDVEAELSVIERRDGVVIHLPPGVDKETRTLLADEHAYRLSQLEQRLGIDVQQTIHSYVYTSRQQKARLMGGRATMIAKTWLREIHIHGTQSPHLTLAHELVHVVAAEFGTDLLGVSAEWVIDVNMTLVEGLAEALSPERGEVDLDGWARAMRELGLAPDVREMISPTGFWNQAPRRAYTVAGSFVRYLLDAYGAEPLKQAYAAADFETAYGKSLDYLASEWEERIDRRELSDLEKRIAEERFRRPSIFARTCAHEVAQLRRQAIAAQPAAAIEIYRRICEHLGHTPASVIDLAEAYYRAEQVGAFLEVSGRLLQADRVNAVQRARMLELRAALFWERGEIEAARLATQEVLESRVSRASERAAWVKLWAMQMPPPLATSVRRLFARDLDPLAAVVALQDARRVLEDDRTLPYLIAYQLMRVRAWEQALAYLAAAAGHPYPTIEAERLRLVATALWRLDRLDEAEQAFAIYAESAPTPGERARALDMAAWVQWMTAR